MSEMLTLRCAGLMRVAFCATACMAIQAVALAASAESPEKRKAASAQQRIVTVILDNIEPEHKSGAKYRTPATIDSELLDDFAKHLQAPMLKVSTGQAATHFTPGLGPARLRLTAIGDGSTVPRDYTVVPVAYRAEPMAIMRIDTAINSWKQLKGRTVCLARGSRHVGMAASRHGAIEKDYASVTDALIAMRSGACDALVHDSAMLQELIRLPEWKKFSARLLAVHSSTLAFLLPTSDTEMLAQAWKIAAKWKTEAHPDALVKKAVRNIAFEVYLDQEVPDCH